MKPDEEKLKCHLLAKLRRDHILSASSTIASEFVLGQTGCRSDLAVWNGNFIGIEVKSARDTLSRLPYQIAAYRKFFDTVIVLCDEVHLPKAEILCPDDVGIHVWSNGKLSVFRNATINQEINRRECVRSLSIKQLYSGLGLKSSAKYSRSQLEQRVLADTSIDVRSLVITGFEATYRTTTDNFFNAITGRRIIPDHLKHLSRFAVTRAELKYNHNAREIFWKQWERQAQVVFS